MNGPQEDMMGVCQFLWKLTGLKQQAKAGDSLFSYVLPLALKLTFPGTSRQSSRQSLCFWRGLPQSGSETLDSSPQQYYSSR